VYSQKNSFTRILKTENALRRVQIISEMARSRTNLKLLHYSTVYRRDSQSFANAL
jgi:hypothetical protein